jgi:hypothetical protein
MEGVLIMCGTIIFIAVFVFIFQRFREKKS